LLESGPILAGIETLRDVVVAGLMSVSNRLRSSWCVAEPVYSAIVEDPYDLASGVAESLSCCQPAQNKTAANRKTHCQPPFVGSFTVVIPRVAPTPNWARGGGGGGGVLQLRSTLRRARPGRGLWAPPGARRAGRPRSP